jgi:plasmid stabilization system protein ParE
MTYELLIPANAELQEAIAYYEGERPGLGEEFALEVQDAIARILENPLAWTRLSKQIHQCQVRRFPYVVIYQIRADLILIVAVKHHRRRPMYWRNRLR